MTNDSTKSAAPAKTASIKPARSKPEAPIEAQPVPSPVKPAEVEAAATAVAPKDEPVKTETVVEPAVVATVALVEQAAEASEVAAAAGDDAFDAVVRSTTVAVEGCEALGAEWLSYCSASWAESVRVSTALATCASIEEAIAIQSGFLANSWRSCVAEGSKLSEISMRTADGAFRPLGDYLGKAVSATRVNV